MALPDIHVQHTADMQEARVGEAKVLVKNLHLSCGPENSQRMCDRKQSKG